MNYIYMSGEGKRANKRNRVVYFKVGYSKHPVYRGRQLSYEACRDLDIEYNLAVSAKHTYAVGDKATAQKVEKYVLDKVAQMARATIGKEHFLITKANRKQCYKMLAQWCEEAIAQKEE